MDSAHVNVRLDGALTQKLAALARVTHRTRSDVMRLLLAQARLPGTPDIVLEDYYHREEEPIAA